MTFSLITPCLNSASTISQTLASLKAQTYKDWEYIIIDGGSSDGTLAVIARERADLPLTLVSEPDQGIYDAMNKGIGRASGDIIGILNADDFYADKNVLTKVAAAFASHPETEIVYGDLEIVKADNPEKTVRRWRAGQYRPERLRRGWIMPHPACFVKRTAYEKYGGFNPSFRLAADYEFLLRLLKRHGLKPVYIPEILVIMRAGGLSGRDLKQRRQGWRELKRAWLVNGWRPPFLLVGRRLFSKLRQLFRSRN